MDGFLSMLSPGALMTGLDFQDCCLHCLTSPARRRLPGVRRPATRRLGVYLSLPCGLGPFPGWDCSAGSRCREPRIA